MSGEVNIIHTFICMHCLNFWFLRVLKNKTSRFFKPLPFVKDVKTEEKPEDRLFRDILGVVSQVLSLLFWTNLPIFVLHTSFRIMYCNMRYTVHGVKCSILRDVLLNALFAALTYLVAFCLYRVVL